MRAKGEAFRMDPMERSWRRRAATKMVIFGVLAVLFGAAVASLGIVGGIEIRLLVIGTGFIVVGVLMFVRASRHMRGAAE